MNIKDLSDDDLMALKSGDLSKMSDAGLMSLKGASKPTTPKQSSNFDVFKNAIVEGAASVPDMVLNTPTNVFNLVKAGIGFPLVKAGLPDLAPTLSKNPDLARTGAIKTGLIDESVVPQGATQKIIDVLTRGAVRGALPGGAGLTRAATSAG